ncbi:MAG: isoprenylcysteine carboxylmethyltransferase family protein, partial [Bacteroidales bacterium]
SILLTVVFISLNYFLFSDLVFCIGNRLINTLIGAFLISIGVFALLIPAQRVTKYYKESKLCRTGIYAYLRHPIYAAWILAIVPGIVIISGAVLGLLIPFIMYILFKTMIGEEEQYLKTTFGQDYLDYQKRVGSIFPKLNR